jgi:hypothetical protein
LRWEKENQVETEKREDWNDRKLEKLLGELGINLKIAGPIDSQFIEKILENESMRKPIVSEKIIRKKIPKKKYK